MRGLSVAGGIVIKCGGRTGGTLEAVLKGEDCTWQHWPGGLVVYKFADGSRLRAGSGVVAELPRLARPIRGVG
jgi:hypothetical protein